MFSLEECQSISLYVCDVRHIFFFKDMSENRYFPYPSGGRGRNSER